MSCKLKNFKWTELLRPIKCTHIDIKVRKMNPLSFYFRKIRLGHVDAQILQKVQIFIFKEFVNKNSTTTPTATILSISSQKIEILGKIKSFWGYIRIKIGFIYTTYVQLLIGNEILNLCWFMETCKPTLYVTVANAEVTFSCSLTFTTHYFFGKPELYYINLWHKWQIWKYTTQQTFNYHLKKFLFF